ncbi:MAG TPA: hypothetical protein VJ652_09775 [Noviherbaspirillum sp.]|nr:hypothetical protein [Noviherbaspirillum sp.]
MSKRYWIWRFGNMVLAYPIQGACFYWAHRPMHRRALFRFFHRTHQLSIHLNPGRIIR